MVKLDWSFDKVCEAQRSAEADGLSFSDPAGPLFQWNGMHRLEAEKRRFDDGDKMALLGAIRICANHDLVMPDWVARAYIRAYDQVLRCRADSWDTVFGRPYPKGMHLAKARQRDQLRFAIYLRVCEILKANHGTPIDERLFERVGAEFDIGKTLANRLYYEAKRMSDVLIKDNVVTALLAPYVVNPAPRES